jgi:hypothetical protein
MRDPARIDRILDQIRYIWLEQPDLRLCQLIGNALPGADDKYFVEDDDLEAALKSYPRIGPTS